MPKIKYESINFSQRSLKIIQQAESIVTDYKAKGYDLTLRQVYYQFVSRDWLPQEWADPQTGSTNNQRSYKKLGDIISDARMAGLIDWEALVDRTREMGGNSHWSSPESIISAVAQQYAINKWAGQPIRPEVWVEKDALEGIVSQICRRLDIPFFSCRGYCSMTSIWDNAQRLRAIAEDGGTPYILHLGDHDPSGIDMSRDIVERSRLFMNGHGAKLKFKRLALNKDQVDQYNPPENPAKSTDSRYADYVREHGESSWELDALDPAVITDIIRAAVEPLRDDKLYRQREKQERTEKSQLAAVSERWDEVVELVEG
jgi:hypothetical protein